MTNALGTESINNDSRLELGFKGGVKFSGGGLLQNWGLEGGE